MKRYLLDSNAVISLLNDRNSSLAQRIRSHKPEEIAISAIVAHELFYGAFKSKRKQQNVELIDSLRFAVIEFDQEDARQAGELRASLAIAGTPIGPYDVLIAAQAKARKMILVTSNNDEFSRVQGLQIENWQSDS